MKIRAEMGRQRAPLCPPEYQVDKVVEVSTAQFAAFLMRPLDCYDFIRHNSVEPHQGTGHDHCLLVLGEGRTDGVLVQCGNGGRTAYSAYVAGARDVVQARLDRVADFIVSQGTQRTASGSWYVYCEELDEKFGVAVQEGTGLDTMLKDTLERRPEVARVDSSLQHIETTFRPEFCAQLRGSAEKTQPDIRLRDILPLLTNTGLEYPCQSFFTHQETDLRVWPDDLRKLTTAGQREHDALLNARVVGIVPTDEGLSAYAAQRLVGFEQHRLGDAYRQPETRHEWIRDILRGMAEVCGQDAAPFLQSFERRLTDAHGASAVEVLSPADQKHMIRSLDRYVSVLGRMEGDQRSRIFHARELLEEVCAYLPWDPDANGARSARDRAWEQLQRAVARRPIRFTRVLLGGELDPGGIEFLPGMVNDEESVRRTQEFQRLTVEYPKREEWPALCVVCMGGGRREDAGTVDADGLDMAVIREAGEAFMKRAEVRPVWVHQLAVPVHEQIRVLKFEPGKAPEEVIVPNTLEAFQSAVGGDIDVRDLDSDASLMPPMSWASSTGTGWAAPLMRTAPSGTSVRRLPDSRS